MRCNGDGNGNVQAGASGDEVCGAIAVRADAPSTAGLSGGASLASKPASSSAAMRWRGPVASASYDTCARGAGSSATSAARTPATARSARSAADVHAPHVMPSTISVRRAAGAAAARGGGAFSAESNEASKPASSTAATTATSATRAASTTTTAWLASSATSAESTPANRGERARPCVSPRVRHKWARQCHAARGAMPRVAHCAGAS